MREFKVNEYITLKLENKQTVIYVADKRFRQCIYLLLDISVEKISSFDEIESIDEIIENLDKGKLVRKIPQRKIPSEVEFWGHCSHMQMWVENNYNSKLLDSNLAFPLLKKLTEVGDPIAKKAFKKEIIKRFLSGFEPVMIYLTKEWYLRYLDGKEAEEIFEFIKNKYSAEKNSIFFFEIMRQLGANNELISNIYTKSILKVFSMKNEYLMRFLIHRGNLGYLSIKQEKTLIENMRKEDMDEEFQLLYFKTLKALNVKGDQELKDLLKNEYLEQMLNGSLYVIHALFHDEYYQELLEDFLLTMGFSYGVIMGFEHIHDSEILLIISDFHFNKGNYYKALKLCDESIKYKPDQEEAYVHKLNLIKIILNRDILFPDKNFKKKLTSLLDIGINIQVESLLKHLSKIDITNNRYKRKISLYLSKMIIDFPNLTYPINNILKKIRGVTPISFKINVKERQVNGMGTVYVQIIIDGNIIFNDETGLINICTLERGITENINLDPIDSNNEILAHGCGCYPCCGGFLWSLKHEGEYVIINHIHEGAFHRKDNVYFEGEYQVKLEDYRSEVEKVKKYLNSIRPNYF